MLFLFISFLVIFSAVMACDEARCNHPDYGSCGNACCKLSFNIPASTFEVMNKLNTTIFAGGPDGLYIPQMTAEGTASFADFRSRTPPPPVDFIGQTWHTTKSGVYNDTINFTLTAEGEEATHLLAFSTSQIAGAYGDAGQNYFNIVQLIQSLWVLEPMHEDSSCPKAV